jgi:hypothetical protein
MVGAELERVLRAWHLVAESSHDVVVTPPVAEVVERHGAEPGLGVIEADDFRW